MRYGEDPGLRHVPVGDADPRADRVGRGWGTGFLAFTDGADAERTVVGNRLFHHLDITLLEYSQRQPSTGEHHGIERE